MIDSWFPTLIYRDTLSEFADKNPYLENKANELKNKLNGSLDTHWQCDTFNTLGQYNPYDDNDTVINNLIETCKIKVLEFSKVYGIEKRITDLCCHDFWFNISSTGNFQEYHQHTNSHFSLVYYVKAPLGSGNIHFKSIESITDMFDLPIHHKNLTQASYKSCMYEPKNSMVLIFRSNLLHMVAKNLSDQDRISISMNFRFY